VLEGGRNFFGLELTWDAPYLATLRKGGVPHLCAPANQSIDHSAWLSVTTRSCLGYDGIKPTQPAKPRKIPIGGAQRKPVFHGQRSQMSVWYEIAMYARQHEKLT
jgi:hypothetical protein